MTAFFILSLHQLEAYVHTPGLLFRQFLIVDIQTPAHITFEGSIGRVSWYSTIEDPAVLAGMMPQPVLHFEWAPGIKTAQVKLQATVEVVRVNIIAQPWPTSRSRGRPTKSRASPC